MIASSKHSLYNATALNTHPCLMGFHVYCSSVEYTQVECHAFSNNSKTSIVLKVAGAASVAVDFFLHNMLPIY